MSLSIQIHVAYRVVCAVGVGGEGWVGESERVGRGEAHEQRVVESGFVVIPIYALELLELLAHVHAPRGWDAVGRIVDGQPGGVVANSLLHRAGAVGYSHDAAKRVTHVAVAVPASVVVLGEESAAPLQAASPTADAQHVAVVFAEGGSRPLLLAHHRVAVLNASHRRDVIARLRLALLHAVGVVAQAQCVAVVHRESYRQVTVVVEN